MDLKLQTMWGLRDCAKCEGDVCDEPSRRHRALGYEHWPTCPGRLLRSSAWQYVLELQNAKQVAPLEGWPTRYAPWVVDALGALERAAVDKWKKDQKTKEP